MPAADYELVQTLSPEKGTEIIAKFKLKARPNCARGQVIANVGNVDRSRGLSAVRRPVVHMDVPDQTVHTLPTNSHNEAAAGTHDRVVNIIKFELFYCR